MDWNCKTLYFYKDQNNIDSLNKNIYDQIKIARWVAAKSWPIFPKIWGRGKNRKILILLNNINVEMPKIGNLVKKI